MNDNKGIFKIFFIYLLFVFMIEPMTKIIMDEKIHIITIYYFFYYFLWVIIIIYLYFLAY